MEPEVYQRMAELEDRHWWFVGRRRIIGEVLSRFGGSRQGEILEAGSGTGGNLAMLARFGHVVALEPDVNARKLAMRKGDFDIKDGALPDAIPFEQNHFDLVVAFDVLEHLDDDLASVQALMRHLKPGGLAVFTVPACPRLWSSHDEIHHHKRRYTKTSLSGLIHNAGYQPLYLSHFNTLLFPAICAVRFINKLLGRKHSDDETLPPNWLNRSLTRLFSLERRLIGRATLPMGVSLLVVVQKCS